MSMTVRPRLALATTSADHEPSAAGLGLLAGLRAMRWRVQHFRSRACPIGYAAILQATGRPGRHLDAWLMPDSVCRCVFARGADRADLAVVEGTFDRSGEAFPAPGDDERVCGRRGGLAPVAATLDLPVVAVVEARCWDTLHLTSVPASAEAVLLDGLENPDEFDRIADAVRLLTGRPVLGAVEALPEARRAMRDTPRNRTVPEAAIAALGSSFLRFANLPLLRTLAMSRLFPGETPAPVLRDGPRFRVAYAQDEAFGGYFPDTLEMLEALGAELVEFSPLRSEHLPADSDLVMIGCGYPDEHADALAANFGLINALRCHVYRGRRIYSEGGGTAYLGRSMTVDGHTVPGVGILPFDAERRANSTLPYPVSRTLEVDTWLAPRGSEVRGYHSDRWDLRPSAELCHQAAGFGPLTAEHDFFHHHHAVGGLIHLHLAALPQVVAAFAGPHRPSLTLRHRDR